jgi:hypothetical protein
MISFVILALHRTGSTYLVNTLNAHPDIVCKGEIFRSKARENDLYDPIPFMDHWLDAKKNIPFVGFKLMLDQDDEVLREIARRRFRIMLLTRPNELAQYSSQLIARKTGKRVHRAYLAKRVKGIFKATGISHNSNLARLLIDAANRFDKTSPEKVKFNPKHFHGMRQRVIRLVRKTEAILAEYNIEPLRLEYPQITTKETIRGALRFIGAEEMDLVPTVKKMNSPNILERFSNPDEVLRFLGEVRLPEWEYEG